MDSRRSRLNVPSGMEASLHLTAIPPTTYISPMPKSSPSPNKVTYFNLTDKPVPACDGASEDYAHLLYKELFWLDSSPADDRSPNKNIFRYKINYQSPGSPLSTKNLFGQDEFDGMIGGRVETPPPKVPCKVPKTPQKVLDALALQDDFYLNLVDWSSQNTLAVGLGTCVYLWNTSSSKVTKLCDLGPMNDEVCVVQWSREGSYLSVGSNRGNVQIAPLAVSDASVLAPKEIFEEKGDIKEEAELTQEERKRRRANKKKET